MEKNKNFKTASKGDCKISFNFNMNVIKNGQTSQSVHIDGEVSVEKASAFIRTTVANAIRGVADGLEKEEAEDKDRFVDPLP
jgi:ribosomal protein L6P/L9E